MQATNSLSYRCLVHCSHCGANLVNEVERELWGKLSQLLAELNHESKGIPGNETSYVWMSRRRLAIDAAKRTLPRYYRSLIVLEVTANGTEKIICGTTELFIDWIDTEEANVKECRRNIGEPREPFREWGLHILQLRFNRAQVLQGQRALSGELGMRTCSETHFDNAISIYRGECQTELPPPNHELRGLCFSHRIVRILHF